MCHFAAGRQKYRVLSDFPLKIDGEVQNLGKRSVTKQSFRTSFGVYNRHFALVRIEKQSFQNSRSDRAARHSTGNGKPDEIL